VPSRAPRLPIADGPAVRAALLVTLPSRISAILARADGVVFVGTFDAGVFRFDPAHAGAPVAVGALQGRERFVDALVEHDGRIVVGTHRGAVLLAPDGARLGVVATDEAVAALAVVDGELVLGTAHGLWAGTPPAPLDARGPDGEPLRVTALAASSARVWIGTATGVYALSRPLHAEVARWYPLVFGVPPASTDVVTALVPLDDGVLAGTDDGGLARVTVEGVQALPFSDRRANDVNPGALARLGDGVFVGTEGAGLLRVAASGAVAARPRDWPRARVSAVAAGARLYVGTEEGELWTIQPEAASSIFWMSAS
jgi:ligand-binding sensor domain-containing protein